MNAENKFTDLERNYASVQDTASHSELKSIDGDFPTFEIDQNKPIDVGPSTFKALILQEPVKYFDYQQQIQQNIVKLPNFSLWMQIHALNAWKSVKFAAKMTIQRKIQFLAASSLSIFHVTHGRTSKGPNPGFGHTLVKHHLVAQWSKRPICNFWRWNAQNG